MTRLEIRRPANFSFQSGQWVKIASTAIGEQVWPLFYCSFSYCSIFFHWQDYINSLLALLHNENIHSRLHLVKVKCIVWLSICLPLPQYYCIQNDTDAQHHLIHTSLEKYLRLGNPVRYSSHLSTAIYRMCNRCSYTVTKCDEELNIFHGKISNFQKPKESMTYIQCCSFVSFIHRLKKITHTQKTMSCRYWIKNTAKHKKFFERGMYKEKEIPLVETITLTEKSSLNTQRHNDYKNLLRKITRNMRK